MNKIIELGGKADDIIFANPCKQRSHIECAKKHGIKLMTFDSKEELTNIHDVYPEAELIFRISVESTDAPGAMGKKFGAPRELWQEVLEECIVKNMKVRGVSFHVGTGGCSFSVYQRSL
jgi:ornithine decarboxylase